MRPENHRFDIGQGTIKRVYPKTWEVDILAENGGLVQRAIVVGPRLPEISAKEIGAPYPKRPQWCVFAYVDHLQGQPIAWMIPSRLPPPELDRSFYVYYEEVGNFRVTINRDNELEIRNVNGEVVSRVRIQQIDGVVRLDTPHTRIVLKETDKSILVECDETLTVHCKNAVVNVDEDADITVGENVNLDVGGNLDATVGGNVSAEVTGNLDANIGGNATVDVTGTVSLTAASVTVTAATTTFSGNVTITGILTMA